MADHNKPTLSSQYPQVLSELDGRLKDLAAAFDPAKVSPTNVPANAVRWSSAAKKWQLWNGAAWGDLESEYAINISGSAATLKTARTIALSGGATGTATSFNGSTNITIPVTALDASKLTGTIPSGLLDGKADKAITIVGTGYLTGGGSLAANRTIDLDSAVKAKFDRFLPAYTFTEIAALPSNIGPVLCTDMGPSFLYVWTTSAYFTGYRSVFCGELPRNFAPSPRAWEALVTGGVWSESDPKQKRLIALFREQGLVIAAGSWKKGDGYIADLGSGNWKAPDLQDQFLRIAGTDVDTANARNAGTGQGDQNKTHRHQAEYLFNSNVLAGTNLLILTTNTSYGVAANTGYAGGVEARPTNTAVAAVITI